ncbi:hypothetical protein [Paenibacillus puerhi]|uniref:hypothetical protein n=1 Tax=Paenibacillus puerhi TaxID=2692622 RepID=UPI00135A6141|nr:hypothetical protein [Paenibacillus puerhi]
MAIHVKRRSWLALVAAALAVGGCSSGGGDVKSGEAAEPDKVPSFKVMFDYNVDAKGMSLSDNEYIDYLQQQTGVRSSWNLRDRPVTWTSSTL